MAKLKFKIKTLKLLTDISRLKERLLFPHKFEGIWASFAYLDETVACIKALRQKGSRPSVLSPCPRHELEHALGSPQSKLPFITLVFGAMGLFFGYGLPTWTAMDWVLPVSSKPIISIPAFSIIGFELMVLLSGLATAVGIFLLGYISLRKQPLPRSEEFLNYGRFSLDRFGVAVPCEEAQLNNIKKLMLHHGAEKVVHEKGS